MAKEPTVTTSSGDFASLTAENIRLRKTVDALMKRVERDIDQQADAFTLFQTAAKLEEAIKVRTKELETVNRRLTHELGVRQQIEEALRLAKEQAEEADKLKTRFLAAASHDLRQPLNSALLFLEAIEGSRLPAKELGFLNKTKVALGSLNSLFGTLLDVTKLDSGMIDPHINHFAIADVLDPLASEYAELSSNSSVSFSYVRSSAVVRSDQHLLETVVRNLVTNAIRYTPSGKVLIGCRRLQQKVRICIYDTGVGISATELKRIFEAYYQSTNPRVAQAAGMGLGLSIVDRIATLLSLQLHVISEPGKGSLFAVDVPLGDAFKLAESRYTAAFPDNLLNRIMVVIDDNSDVLNSMKANIDRWGCRTVFARDASQALVELISADLEPDCIISDYHLTHGENGFEAIEQIRKEFSNDIFSILMTSDPNPAIREVSQQKGYAFITKPLNMAKLRALISQTL
jgi:signal transduction histidine kinase/CheY-like chemotaxis protein